MPSTKSVVIGAVGLAGAVAGQYFPPTPEGLKVVHSKHEKGVKISYKEVRSHLTLLDFSPNMRNSVKQPPT